MSKKYWRIGEPVKLLKEEFVKKHDQLNLESPSVRSVVKL